ncbi:MAG: SDR family oxidoreductase [Chloroflexi bacterium]|nr:SDR family oxidoreductase [Chloroflexota bacterium]MDA1240570.1 SDR family oxidoreductase [Chloroflexota bacterium]MQC47839.1 SDR family oxidoreductase [Chloroflexota bacterium]
MLERFDLDGKAVVVTGGGRGLGRGMALALAEAGASVMVAARTQEQLDRVAGEIRAAGGTAATFAFDATNPDQAGEMIGAAVREFGKVDAVFANAGGGGGATAEFHEYPADGFDAVLATNLKSNFYTSRAAAAQMIKQGHGGVIVVTASGTAMRGNRQFAYPTAKGGVISLAKSMAVMLAGHDIRTHCIVPGFVSQAPPKDDQERAFREQRGKFLPAQRLGEWWEMGPLAIFLASDASSYMTGHSFVIDGGGLAGGLGPIAFRPRHEW